MLNGDLIIMKIGMALRALQMIFSTDTPTNRIQREIVKQLLYGVDPKDVPLSRFHRIHEKGEASASYPVLNWLGNSLIISTVFAVLSVCIVALAGFGYSRLNFKYRDTLFFVLLLISMFPAVVNMIPQYRIIASLGWVNTYWACIIPGLGNVANIFLVRNFMKGIPKELDEAAEIDGATDFQIFTRIMLPAIRPILIVIFLFSFTGAWNDFLWPTLVFNDINKMPVTAGLQLLSNQMGQYNQMGSLMAATCMAIIPTLLLFLFAQKYFLQSLNITSGLKG